MKDFFKLHISNLYKYGEYSEIINAFLKKTKSYQDIETKKKQLFIQLMEVNMNKSTFVIKNRPLIDKFFNEVKETMLYLDLTNNNLKINNYYLVEDNENKFKIVYYDSDFNLNSLYGKTIKVNKNTKFKLINKKISTRCKIIIEIFNSLFNINIKKIN